MLDKEIVESISFGNHQPPSEYVKTDTGQLVTPEFLALIQQSLSGKLSESRQTDELPPEVKALAEELSVIHLPEWRSEVGRKLAEPTVTSIKQAVRVAEYLVKRGVRVHPDLEEIRWTPTPGGQPGVFDTALHLTKDATGNWPAPDPEVFYNLEDIQVTKTDDGLWSATHPRGLATEAPTKTDAYAALVDQLRARIDQARQARDE
ncbi:hypothetical protein [Nocardia seriolae]|uniref:hypothetical protein n=1 Tax=Nocardia seriolae TaxID=37332 RepID=UPI0008FF6800|nr:hypothetical protein [Nocardia seriolae]OJF83523.1 hypothetical protein NS14008_35995 [Nocardia seriolae]PSK26977.1 hypothetical protein C6575_34305 [Nocardia seriolae]QOW32314.1 hypothetical protein IMZ23_30680 [Nocardia seriolae]QUN19923.1 hypothetical protein KEC46_11755 [Nocardia seriolae]WNJ59404.1 hypothetical protein RMO66_00630 [Nocardia seriolae]